MKIISTILLLSLSFLQLNSQVFVDLNATGNNDGSTWEHAFTDLNLAISSANASEIWIAQGVYKPPLQDSTHYYHIQTGHKIYGGFAGTETALSERDVAINKTILSGDINDDDIPSSIFTNRMDNAYHLLYIDENEQAVEIDGLYFLNGSTEINPNVSTDFNARGAGILSLSKVHINNCVFENNLANGGACIFITGLQTAGSTISSCSFSNNHSNNQSAGILINQTEGCIISHCSFSNNMTNRGVLYSLDSPSTIIKNCDFDANSAIVDAWCAGIYNSGSINNIIDSCTFSNLTADNAPAIYLDSRDFDPQIYQTASITNCSFSKLNSIDFGGGLRTYKANYTMDHCTFSECTAAGTGGGLYHSNTFFEVSNTSFSNGEAIYGAGSASYYSSVGVFNNCQFTNNTSDIGGGGSIVGFTSDVFYKNCLFEKNNASLGAGLYVITQPVKAQIDSCVFIENTAEERGGGFGSSKGGTYIIKNSLFKSNVAELGGGVGLGSDPEAVGSFEIDKCDFFENMASKQGGAINIFDISGSIKSSLISYNIAAGNGGAISQHSFEDRSSYVSLTNSTIAYNEGKATDGISQFEDLGDANLNILNCIIYHEGGIDYAVEEGDPTLISLGGNLVSQNNLSEIFGQEKDLLGEDPLFENPEEAKFSLKNTSPAINTGIADGAHESDIFGNPVLGIPDKGAFESEVMVIVNDLEKEDDFFQLINNPTRQYLNGTILLNTRATISTRIISANGRVLQKTALQYGLQNFQVDVRQLPAGAYFILLNTENKYSIKPFLKI